MSPCNVREFGAVGDGTTNDTAAIRAAVAHLAGGGGGTVHFPPGDYLCGTLRLTDHIALHLDAGAVLRESYQDDIEPTPVGVGVQRHHLIVAQGVGHIAITGQGTILGRGESDSPGLDRDARGFRSGVIFFRDCHQVRISDVTIRCGDGWTVHLCRCQGVFVQGVSIINRMHRIGGNDGLDLNSCRNVHVSDCHIEAWDDCIVLKAKDMDEPGDATVCENIVVTNCTLKTGCTALKLGSESVGDFRDIHFSNCTVEDSSVGFGIYLLDGATIERVTLSNVSMRIVPDNRYRPHMEPLNLHVFPLCIFVGQRTPQSRIGTLRDVTIRDVTAMCSHGAVILGHPQRPIENLTLDHVTLRIEAAVPFVARNLPCSRGWVEDQTRLIRQGDPPVVLFEPAPDGVEHRPAYLNISRVRDLTLCNVAVYMPAVTADGVERSGIALDAVSDGHARDCIVRLARQAVTPPIFTTATCRGMSVNELQPADAAC